MKLLPNIMLTHLLFLALVACGGEAIDPAIDQGQLKGQNKVEDAPPTDDGCQIPDHCPAEDDPSIEWVSRDVSFCARVLFFCAEDQVGFSDECGCGCRYDSTACPDPNHPTVHYVSQDVLECALILFYCEEGQRGFSTECGCGCIDE